MAYLLAMKGGFSITGRVQLQNTNFKPIGEPVWEVGSPPQQDFPGTAQFFTLEISSVCRLPLLHWKGSH